jgi:hypothetical protein
MVVIEYCVNFKDCMKCNCFNYVRVPIGVFAIIISLDGVRDIHRCPIGGEYVTDPLGATINWSQHFGNITELLPAARYNEKLGVETT